jgi:hypothetical protein
MKTKASQRISQVIAPTLTAKMYNTYNCMLIVIMFDCTLLKHCLYEHHRNNHIRYNLLKDLIFR